MMVMSADTEFFLFFSNVPLKLHGAHRLAILRGTANPEGKAQALQGSPRVDASRYSKKLRLYNSSAFEDAWSYGKPCGRLRAAFFWPFIESWYPEAVPVWRPCFPSGAG